MQTVNDAPDRTNQPGPRDGLTNVFSALGTGRVALLAALIIVLVSAKALPVQHLLDLPLPAAWLPLHIAMGMVAVIVALLVFATGWHAGSRHSAGSIALIACAFLAAGLLDLAHTLSYPGMPDLVTPNSTDKAIHFWLAARGMAGCALLAVACLSWRPFASSSTRNWLLATALGVAALAYWLVLLHPNTLPRAFVPGQGPAPFKIGAEYALVAVYALASGIFVIRLRPDPAPLWRDLFAACCILALSELFFLFHRDLTDLYTLLGNTCRVIGYGFIYHALLERRAAEPHEELRRTQLALQQSTARYQHLVDLSSNWYWEQDAGFRFSFMAVAELIRNGLPAEGLAVKRRRELPITHVYEDEWEQHRLILEQRRPFRDFTYHVIGDRGELRWFSISGEPIFDAAGEFKGYHCVGTDVTERRQAQQRQDMEHIVTRVLAESESLAAAVPQILQTICQTLAWDCGAYWTLDDRRQLNCAGTWSLPNDTGPGEFMARSSELTFAAGQSGLIRRALISEQPVWIPDAASDPTFSRAAQAAAAGLHGALAFPLLTASKTLGVMEFYSRHVRQPEPVLIEATRSIGAQIGQFIRSQRMDEARRASEARLSGIVQSAMSAIIMADEDMNIVLFNPAAEKMFGHTAADMIGAGIERLIPGRFSHAHHKYVTGFGASKASIRSMSRRGGIYGLRANGEEFPGEASISHVTLAGRKFYTIILSDITERAKTEENLRLAATAIENAQEGIVITDASNRIISVNPAFTRITGYTAEEAIGSSPNLLSSGMQDKAFYQSMWTAINETGSWQGEIWDRRKSGELYCEWLSISAVKNTQGKIAHHTAIFSDITERKLAASELARKTRLTALLEALARAANEAATPEAAMKVCLERICAYGSWTLGHFGIYAPGQLTGASQASFWHGKEQGLYSEFIRRSDKLAHNVAHGQFTGRALREQQPVWVEDLTRAAGFGRLDLARSAGIRAGFVFPVVVSGEAAAFLEFFAEDAREPDTQLLEALDSVASQLARLIERGRAEVARGQLAAIVEGSHDAIFSRTLDGFITSWNAGAERMFGFTASEAIGRPAGFNLPPGRRPNLARNTEQIRRGEATVPHESTRMTRDGRAIDVLTSHSPIRDSAGNIVGASVILHDITVLKLAEAARAELAAIVENSNDAIISRTFDGRILTWNAGAELMFGYSASEAIGKLISFNTPPGRVPIFSKITERILRGEKLTPHETQRLNKDGRVLDVLSSVSPIKNDAGEFIAIASIFQDITALKRAEAERSRLAAIVESSNDAIMTRTLDGIITSWNVGAERMLGYSAAEAIGKPATLFLLPERQYMVSDNTARVLRDKVIPPHETKRITRDGRIIDVLSSHSPIRDGAGNIIGASVILHDITALKRAEAAIRESEQRFHAAFEQAGVGMGLREFDPLKPRWIRVNQKLCDILGYKREELLQLTSVEITPPEERDTAIDYNRKLRRGEIKNYSREKRYMRKDGSAIWTNLTIATINSPDGRPTHIISVIEDISERKRAREEIITLNAELEQRVSDRTRQLEATNKELESFSYSVSHDLRAPLRGINGFSKLLLKEYGDRLDTKAGDYLQRINRATLRMGELIDDLLQLSRVASHQLAPEPVDLSRLADTILAEFREREPERTVATEVQAGIVIHGDARLLRIVLENLLGNAWKFTQKQPQPRIRFGASGLDGKTVIWVRDNGAGFDMAYAHKLFGAFQRLHRADEFEGTGIGLATVQRIVTLHGGRVWAESEVGKGAVFYLAI